MAEHINADPNVLPGIELECLSFDHKCNPGLGIK
jgi:hypothetical protein